MNYFFWLLLNLSGPVFFLALAAVSYGRAVAGEIILESVKDGQLYWSAIAISAAGFYEATIFLVRGALPSAVSNRTFRFSRAPS